MRHGDPDLLKSLPLAWNRLVKLTENEDEISYQYDALTRRTTKSSSAETRAYYYDRQWRAVEERVDGDVSASYVWSPTDRWTMIRRSRPAAGEETEHLYVLKDYLDPAAVIDSSANVIERFGYDAFGPVRFMDAGFGEKPSSDCGWNFLFHAEFLDADSGLYNYGFRYYHPELGRWLSKDPIAEKGGLNLYAFVGNNGTNWSDLLGLAHYACPEGECCVRGQCDRCPDDLGADGAVVMAEVGGLLRWEKIGVGMFLGAIIGGVAINETLVTMRACQELIGPGDEIIIKTRFNHLMDGVIGPLVNNRPIYTRVFLDEDGLCQYEYVVGRPGGGLAV